MVLIAEQPIFTVANIYQSLVVIGAIFAQWIWLIKKMSEHDVRIAELEGKYTEHEKVMKEEREKIAQELVIASREVTSTFVRVFEKMDEITEHLTNNKDELKDAIGKINVTCAGHEARTRDVIIKIMKDHGILKSS